MQSTYNKNLTAENGIFEITVPDAVNSSILPENIPLDIRMQTDEDFQEATMLQREDLIARLQVEGNIVARERLARNLMTQRCSKQNSLFLEHFIELQKYVPFDLLIEKVEKKEE